MNAMKDRIERWMRNGLRKRLPPQQVKGIWVLKEEDLLRAVYHWICDCPEVHDLVRRLSVNKFFPRQFEPEDWESFSWVKEFPDGHPPLLLQAESWIGVGDPWGVTLFLQENEERAERWETRFIDVHDYSTVYRMLDYWTKVPPSDFERRLEVLGFTNQGTD